MSVFFEYFLIRAYLWLFLRQEKLNFLLYFYLIKLRVLVRAIKFLNNIKQKRFFYFLINMPAVVDKGNKLIIGVFQIELK